MSCETFRSNGISRLVVYRVQVWHGPHCGWCAIERARVMNPSIRGIHEHAAPALRCAARRRRRARSLLLPRASPRPATKFLRALRAINYE